MKMELTKFDELWGAVKRFNVLKVSTTPLFVHAGLDTDLGDIFATDDGLLTVLEDGTVRKAIIYIAERKAWYDDKGFDYPKYHMFHCQTIETMTKKKKKDRYKKTSRDDDKFFMLKSHSDGRSETFFHGLEVCGYCVKIFNERYSKKYSKSTFKSKYYYSEKLFNLLEFLNYKEDFTTAPSYYSKQWKSISTNLKQQRNYTCETCGIVLDDERYKKYIHTHHVDSNPSNNVISNLKVLCIVCHAMEHNHSHIKSSTDYKEFMSLKSKGKIQ